MKRLIRSIMSVFRYRSLRPTKKEHARTLELWKKRHEAEQWPGSKKRK